MSENPVGVVPGVPAHAGLRQQEMPQRRLLGVGERLVRRKLLCQQSRHRSSRAFERAYNGGVAAAVTKIGNFPLARWDDGSIRISGSRIRLEYVLREFLEGSTAEQIRDAYPSLTLVDIYGAIYYFLTHREEATAYLQDAEKAEDEAQEKLAASRVADELRRRLRERANDIRANTRR